MDFESLWRLFEDLVMHRRSQSLHLIVDAIDECEVNEQERIVHHLMKSLSWGTASPIKLLMTSRPHSPAVTAMRNEDASILMLLALENKNEVLKADVNTYIQHHVAINVNF